MGATCQRLGSPRPLWLRRLMARVEMKRLHGAWTAAAPRRFAAQALAWGALRLGYARALPGTYCRCPVLHGRPPYSLLQYYKPADHIMPCIPEYSTYSELGSQIPD